ncbi:MAG TPA: AraC family transcriptional regulator ligand-binding domain-containing protein [Kofleriaceae bacterium]|nr:AraC family transcriptional regulator ligand-binding domain-containing protein [Kofleriaceae bacterium]
MDALPGAYSRDFVELTARWKVEPARLLDGLPLTVEALADPATRVPLRVCEAILARGIELTKEPALGVHLGMAMRVSSHGFLGFAAMTANTVREALELAVQFASTRTNALGLSLHVEGDLASVAIEERTPLPPVLREVLVLALLIGVWQLGTQLTGKPLDGFGECAFARPVFGLPDDRLRFDRPVHRLVFPKSELDLPIVTADVAAKRLAKDQLERALAAIAEGGFITRVRAALADGSPTIVELAKQLQMSTRTLKRRLAEHGTTYSELRDDQRRQRALLLLDDRSLSISEIATRLGYTELPNFTRAFKKWTGLTPAAYRAPTRPPRPAP